MSGETVERVKKVVEIIKRDETNGTLVKFVGTWEYNVLGKNVLDKEVSTVIDSLYKNAPPPSPVTNVPPSSPVTSDQAPLVRTALPPIPVTPDHARTQKLASEVEGASST
jgi:hypothetical protein